MFKLDCHCGAVSLTVHAELPTEAMSCNCSHCRRKGLLLAFYPREQVTLDKGEEALAGYDFNKREIHHRFCSTCGCQPFAEGKMPDGSPTRAINLRCAPDVDLDTIKLNKFDGASS
ncbi:MAG: GFA family protein [Sphingosinicella sp.]|nr:GFA family protein [Sphingosinicella sp.]